MNLFWFLKRVGCELDWKADMGIASEARNTGVGYRNGIGEQQWTWHVKGHHFHLSHVTAGFSSSSSLFFGTKLC